MKKGFFRKFCAATLAFIMAAAASEAVFADVIQIDLDEFVNNSRKYKQNFTYVDLTGVATRGFADEVPGDGVGGWSDQGPSNDMSCFALYGERSFSGIKFKIINPKENNGKSCIMMKGMGDESCPTDVTIPVNAKGKGIYFLHTSPWGDNGKLQEVGSYTIVYSDGTEEVLDLVCGKNVTNWWGGTDTVLDQTAKVWAAGNASSTVGLDLTPYALKNPDKEIKEIKVHTLGEPNVNPYLGIVAITITDTDPYFPVKKPADIGNPDVSDWYPYIVTEDPDVRKGTAVDASNIIEKPSGQHGHIQAVDGRLKFEDGTDCQLWGTVIIGSAIFVDKKEAEANAQYLAKMGFNCVRFHVTTTGIDSNSGVTHINSRDKKGDYISAEQMDKLGYLLNELKKNGIYYGFDLTPPDVYRDNDVKYFDQVQLHLLHWFDKEFMEMLDGLAEQMITWVNPYTGVSLADDPSAAWVSYCNECTTFKYSELKNNLGPYYYQELQDIYNDWLRKKYSSRQALEYAWNDPSSESMALRESEDPYDGTGTVEIFGFNERKKCNTKRANDNLQFFGELEQKSYRQRIDNIKKYAPKLMVQGSTTCLTGADHTPPLYTAAQEGDILSDQCYWYLPYGNGETMVAGTVLSGSPVSSMDSYSKRLGLIGEAVGRNVDGKPYFLTEWDASQPNPWRCENNLEMAVMACTNHWNPIWFAWANIKPDQSYRRYIEDVYMYSGHEINHRPESNAVMPVLGRIVLRGDFEEAEKGYYQNRFYSGEQFDKKYEKTSTDATYGIAGRSSIAFDDIKFDPDYTDNDILKIVKAGDKSGRYMSYTDQVMVDYNKQIFYADSPRTQAATGYIGNETIELDDCIFDMDSQTHHGSVYLQSITDDRISDSDNLLFVYAADCRNDGQEMTEDGKTVVKGGQGPVYIQPMYGRVTLKSKDNYKLYLLNFTGNRVSERKVNHDENGLAYFEVYKEDRTFYYELVRTSKADTDYTPNEVTFLPEGIFDDLFTDLGKYEPYKKEIERICMQDYVKKLAENEFGPEQAFTRGEAVNLLSKIFKFLSANDDPGFADVDKTHIYYDAIASAAAAGMISGDGNSDFRPDAPITKEDFLTMVYRGIQTTKMLRQEERGKVTADLSNVSDYAKEAVRELTRRGYCDEINSLNVKDPANRAEVCILLYRILWE